MNPKPVWLLDIDGVINAYNGPKTGPPNVWPRDAWITVKAGGMTFTAARPVLQLIRRVHRQGLAEIRWHSTWQHDSRLVGAALRLPRFPVQEAPEFTTYTSLSRRPKWWKLPGARRVLQFEQRPLLWTDDDAVDLDTQIRRRMAAVGQPLLIVVPEPRTGLTAADLASIDTFLTSQTGDAKSQPIREDAHQ